MCTAQRLQITLVIFCLPARLPKIFRLLPVLSFPFCPGSLRFVRRRNKLPTRRRKPISVGLGLAVARGWGCTTGRGGTFLKQRGRRRRGWQWRRPHWRTEQRVHLRREGVGAVVVAAHGWGQRSRCRSRRRVWFGLVGCWLLAADTKHRAGGQFFTYFLE